MTFTPITAVVAVEQEQQQPHEVRRERPASHPPIYGPFSQPLTHTPVDQYASYLRSVYTSKKLPTYCKWPPTESKKYIRLAVVKKERVSKQQADEFTKATIHGNIDDICKKKSAVNFEDIGKQEDGTPAKLILVEGAPGIGKTTFAWKVCQKWAEKKILKEYGLVVLLRLRDKRVREVQCVADLFYHSNHELQKLVAKEIQDHQGNSVLLLYEGYDELPRKQQSVFLDILHKQSLPQATVLITSRPSATESLHWELKEQISQHIEILGFTKDDINSYVQHVVKHEKVYTDFLNYLKCYPYIRGMMYVPLNAVIVTEVYQTSQQSNEKFIPTTMTELYTSLTQSVLLRYLLDHSEYRQPKWNLKSDFTGLPKELYKQFCHICEVALKGMIEGEFVFESLPENLTNTLDLMQSVPELYVQCGAVVTYNFFHLTLQEYLAAVKISKLPVKTQIEFFEGNSGSDSVTETEFLLPVSGIGEPSCDRDLETAVDIVNVTSTPIADSLCHFTIPLFQQPSHLPHTNLDRLHPPLSPSLGTKLVDTISTRFWKVLRFVAGLTKYENIPPDSLQQLLFQRKRGGVAKISLNSLHWLFEAQCINIYRDLVRNISILQYSSINNTMTPFDCFVLGYSLSHISCTSDWEIEIILCRVDDECLEMLVGGINFMSTKKDFGITKLSLNNNAITTGGATSLAELLKENRTLQKLNIGGNYIGHGGATALAEMLKQNKTLLQLDVSTNSLGEEGASALAKMLKENSTLQQLNVSSNCVGHKGATELAKVLKENHTLRQLHVSSNAIGQKGANALAEMLKDNSVLQLLNVRGTSLGQEGCTVIAKMLKENRTLQQLNISYNCMGKGGATALADVLKENKTLQQLNISGNAIGQEGAIALAEMLKENRTLQQLDISINSIGQGGATALAEVLKENKTVQQLNMRSNSIGQGGVIALANMLKKNTTLQELNISYMYMGQGEATTLAEILKVDWMLQRLNISGNSIGQNRATTLADMLKKNTTLQQLDVCDNCIGQKGATALAKMLKKNRTLQQLNISINSIGQVGAITLAETLKENRTLLQLNVSCNSIGQGGAIALAEMLKENTTLQHLNVSYNSIGDEGATALAEMLKENRTLQQLNIRRYSTGQAGATALAQMQKVNTEVEVFI